MARYRSMVLTASALLLLPGCAVVTVAGAAAGAAIGVAGAVVHMASLPLEANVQFMTVLATKMPFVGRG